MLELGMDIENILELSEDIQRRARSFGVNANRLFYATIKEARIALRPMWSAPIGLRKHGVAVMTYRVNISRSKQFVHPHYGPTKRKRKHRHHRRYDAEHPRSRPGGHQLIPAEQAAGMITAMLQKNLADAGVMTQEHDWAWH